MAAPATTTAASNRGRRAGTKVRCKPWTATEEAQLRALVDAGTKAQQQKKAMWVEIAAQLGSRTVASVEQHSTTWSDRNAPRAARP